MERTVTKAEDYPAGHTIALSELDQLAVRQCLPLERPQDEEAMDHPFRTAIGSTGRPAHPTATASVNDAEKRRLRKNPSEPRQNR